MTCRIYDLIDGLNIGKDWKITFKKIHLVYHKNYAQGKKLHPIFWTPAGEVSDLSFINSLKIYSWFNPLGLILGPFYYVFKEMYIKGIILLAIFLLLLHVNDATRVMSIFVLIYCAFFINVDYFKKMVLKHPDVISNPLIIENDFDPMVFSKLLEKRTSPLPYILLALILLSFLAPFAQKMKSDKDSLKYLIIEPEKICKDKKECIDTVKKYFQLVNSTNNPKEVSKYYYDIARAYYSADDVLNTLKSLDTAITFDKKNINAYLLRAKLYAKMKNNIQSLLDYKEALAINPKAEFLNYNIGFNYYALGKYEKALEHFEKATKSNDEPLYFEAQAYTRKMLGDSKGAVKDVKKAISLYKKVNDEAKVKKLENFLKKL